MLRVVKVEHVVLFLGSYVYIFCIYDAAYGEKRMERPMAESIIRASKKKHAQRIW